MKAPDRLILIAAIGKAQGLKGQMRLKFFGDNPESLRRYRCFYGADGRVFSVAGLRLQNGAPLLALQGVESRAQAEALSGAELFVRRSQLAALPAGEELFYQDDLLGFRAFAEEDGADLGAVSGFFNFGGGDLLELTLPPQGKRGAKPRKALIPFSKAAVPQVDAAAGRLSVNRAAAGLAAAREEEAREAAAACADNSE